MFMGHPILDEIRQGHQLRPTQTVDKSKPILVADGETFFKNFSASNVRGTIPIVPSTQIPTVTPANPQSCSTSPPPVPCASPPPILFVPPPPVVPPPLPPNLPVAAKVPSKTTNKSALMKLGGNQNVDRDELLRSIRNGVKLRKTQTLDKSIPVVQAEIETREPASSSLTLEKSDSLMLVQPTVNKTVKVFDIQDSVSNVDSSASTYKPYAQGVIKDCATHFNTLPRTPGQETNSICGETVISNNGTMPRSKKADERYSSPIPTREMIEAEIPTGSAANKIKFLNSLHDRAQSQSPIRHIKRNSLTSNQAQNSMYAKFVATKVTESNPNKQPDESEAVTKRQPLAGNSVAKSSSVNSIRKMAQRFDNNILNNQQLIHSQTMWKPGNSSSVSNVNDKLSKFDKISESNETLKNSTSSFAKHANLPDKEPNACRPQAMGGNIRSQVQKFETQHAENSSTNINAASTNSIYSSHNSINRNNTATSTHNRIGSNVQSNGSKCRELEFVPSCSTSFFNGRQQSANSPLLWRRESDKCLATTVTTSFDTQSKDFSENLLKMQQPSIVLKRVPQEKSAKSADVQCLQKSASTESLSRRGCTPVDTSVSKNFSKPFFKYIVPIEIDTSDSPPPVPSTQPPPFASAQQNSVQRNFLDHNSNAQEKLTEIPIETSVPKSTISTSLNFLHLAEPNRSDNSLDTSPISQPSPVNMHLQSESSPNSSNSVSPGSSRISRDFRHHSAKDYNEISMSEAKSELSGKTLLQPTEQFYEAKQRIAMSDERSHLTANANGFIENLKWQSQSNSRSTPQLDLDPEVSRNTGFYSIPINAPWYNKVERVFKNASSRSTEEIYRNSETLPVGKTHRIVVGVTGPNLDAFSDMNPDVFQDNFKFAIDLNSCNLLKVIPR